MNKYYLYRHIRLDKNEPFYIGIGKAPKVFNGYRTEYKRAYATTKRSDFWKSIYNKTEIHVEILYEANNKEQIIEKEKEFIKLYGRRDLKTGTLVNLTNGGDFFEGYVISPESRKQAGLKNRGRKRTKEMNDKGVETRRLNGTYTTSEETKKKQSQARIGRKLTKESIIKREITRRKNTLERGFYRDKEILLSISRKASLTKNPIEKRIKIKELAEKGISYNKISKEFHVSYETIRKIVNNILKCQE